MKNEYDAVADAMNEASVYESHIEHVLYIDIPHWQNGTGDWFTIKLLALIAKADPQNRERIRLGFPQEVEAYERWMRSNSTP